jgi:hypothetical protein
MRSNRIQVAAKSPQRYLDDEDEDEDDEIESADASEEDEDASFDIDEEEAYDEEYRDAV